MNTLSFEEWVNDHREFLTTQKKRREELANVYAIQGETLIAARLLDSHYWEAHAYSHYRYPR